MSKKSRSKVWFLVHSWLALPIWFFVLIVCFTGTLAVVSQELIWVFNPDVRASAPEDNARRLDYDEIMAAVRSAHPGVMIESLTRPDEDHFALTAHVTYPDSVSAELYINPYTGGIQGTAPSFDFKGFTRALHGWWLIPFTNGYSWGWYLVSALGLPMLASLITGLVVYKRFWKGFLKPTLRLRQGARIFWGDFHRLSGIWSIWFIAVISITGTWFLIEAALYDNHISISSEAIAPVIAHDDVPLMKNAEPAPQLGLEESIKIASTRIPGLDVSFVSLPGNAYGQIMVGGRGSYPLLYQTASINPYNGRIEAARLLPDRSALELVTESMRPLHTGDFGGIWIKLIWFFFGLLLSLMVLSGLLIWSKRTAMATLAALKRENRTPRPAPQQPSSAQPRQTPEGAL